jgi:guanylate kinase
MPRLDARPVLFVISGPSGAGKGTALARMVESALVRRVATYTTRAPRPGERDGVDYRFVDEATFFGLYEKGVIFEYTRTYSDSYYGSPSALLADADPGFLAVELDPAGFVRVCASSTRRVVGIFVTTDSEEQLRERLVARGQGQEAERRLRIRTDQLTWAWMYDYVLINRVRDRFLADVELAVRSELLRTEGARHMIELREQVDPTLQAQTAKPDPGSGRGSDPGPGSGRGSDCGPGSGGDSDCGSGRGSGDQPPRDT